MYQQNHPSTVESPPQLPASKASPPTIKRPVTASPKPKKLPSTNPTTPVQQAITTITTTAKLAAQTIAIENTLDNQPIPKLITGGDNIHPYTPYPPYRGHMYAAPHPLPPPPPPHHAVIQYPMPMAPSLAQFQQNAPLPQTNYNLYNQPPPPPSTSRMPGGSGGYYGPP